MSRLPRRHGPGTGRAGWPTWSRKNARNPPGAAAGRKAGPGGARHLTGGARRRVWARGALHSGAPGRTVSGAAHCANQKNFALRQEVATKGARSQLTGVGWRRKRRAGSWEGETRRRSSSLRRALSTFLDVQEERAAHAYYPCGPRPGEELQRGVDEVGRFPSEELQRGVDAAERFPSGDGQRRTRCTGAEPREGSRDHELTVRSFSTSLKPAPFTLETAYPQEPTQAWNGVPVSIDGFETCSLPEGGEGQGFVWPGPGEQGAPGATDGGARGLGHRLDEEDGVQQGVHVARVAGVGVPAVPNGGAEEHAARHARCAQPELA